MPWKNAAFGPFRTVGCKSDPRAGSRRGSQRFDEHLRAASPVVQISSPPAARVRPTQSGNRARETNAWSGSTTRTDPPGPGAGPVFDMPQQVVAASGSAIFGVHGDTGEFGQTVVRKGIQCGTGNDCAITLDHRELPDLLFEQFAGAFDQTPAASMGSISSRMPPTSSIRAVRVASYGSAMTSVPAPSRVNSSDNRMPLW